MEPVSEHQRLVKRGARGHGGEWCAGNAGLEGLGCFWKRCGACARTRLRAHSCVQTPHERSAIRTAHGFTTACFRIAHPRQRRAVQSKSAGCKAAPREVAHCVTALGGWERTRPSRVCSISKLRTHSSSARWKSACVTSAAECAAQASGARRPRCRRSIAVDRMDRASHEVRSGVGSACADRWRWRRRVHLSAFALA